MADKPAKQGLFSNLSDSLAARRSALISLGILIGFGLLANQIWKSSAPGVSRDARYRITAANLNVTTPPPWVRGDIAGEALRNAGLSNTLSLLDPPERLEQPLQQALERHPWVRSVGAIEKAASKVIRIALEYRRPIATIKLAGNVATLDADAVLLPPGALSAPEVSHLPRIKITSAGAPPRLGEPWPSPEIAGATALVAALGPAWRELDFFEISSAATPEVRGFARHHVYELRTTYNTRIAWGAAPGFAPPGEASVAEKLSRLRKFVAEHGPFTSVADSPEWIDIRSRTTARRRIVKNESPDSADEIVK